MGLTSKQRATLVVIVIGTFVTILNQTLVTPALPAIMEEMSIDAATGQWLTSGFTLMNAIMIPITAYLQDRFTVRQLFLFSMAIFAIGTLLAGWSPNFGVLLTGRIVQAMGAGILMPMSMTVLLVMFPIERRGSAMGLFGLVIAFAPAIGPTISGILVDYANWHIMFYVIAALVVVVIILAAFLIENHTDDGSRRDSSLDVPSVILSTVGFGGLLYGFSVFGSDGFTWYSIITTIVGAICVVIFFIRQTKLEVPMLRVRILLNRNFLIATIVCMLVQASLLAAPVIMPIYIQDLLGLPATVSGLVIMPGAIIMGIMNPIAGKIFDRFGARAMSIVGMALLTLSTFAFAFVGLETSIITLTVLYAVRMFSMSLVNMPVTTWGMNSLETKLMNHGTSINNTLRMVAGSLGTAIVVSVYSGVEQFMGASVEPLQASITAFNVSFWVCTAIVVVGLVLTIMFVRGKPGTIEDSDAEAREAGELQGIDSVVASIMKRDVYVIRDDQKVKDAMQLFIDDGISACPIVNAEGDPVGFISDGDILKTLARRTGSYLDPVALIAASADEKLGYDDKLQEVMELPVTAIGPKSIISVSVRSSLDEVCRVLAEHHLKKVPVVDNGRIVGIMNRSDITRYSMEAYLEGHPVDVPKCIEGEDECNEPDETLQESVSAKNEAK